MAEDQIHLTDDGQLSVRMGAQKDLDLSHDFLSFTFFRKHSRNNVPTRKIKENLQKFYIKKC